MTALQSMPTGQLLNEYRDVMLALGANRNDRDLSRRADALEEEINRRVAW
jgi:hypothetical protein